MTSVTTIAWPEPMFMPWKTPEFLPPLTRQPKKKQVVFTTTTTYIFPLEYGGSAVPSDHGPPIGLAKTHTRQECANLEYMPPRRGRVRKFDHVERMVLLQQEASYTRKEVAMFCFETIAIRKSRLETEQDDDEEDGDEEDEREEPTAKRRKGQDKNKYI
ncbi:hypothetical protein LEN26_005818 [Aphanomyces euteiches]|nr:hypothetical protein AeMF1_015887 [Aphanomyces euteiches]KAH9137298.1 hypothetical protein LEN26_005818 [Aphanomyces euteiches]KAH9181282.1 hypothetical protein AeNC1_016743 [Aphanomyces euteiches]